MSKPAKVLHEIVNAPDANLRATAVRLLREAANKLEQHEVDAVWIAWVQKAPYVVTAEMDVLDDEPGERGIRWKRHYLGAE